jgi:hypothetical protein
LVATAVVTVVGGVATNRVSGPWWAQVLWFGGAVAAMLLGARLSLLASRGDVRKCPPFDVDRPSSGTQSIGTVADAVVIGPNADLRGSTFHVTGRSPVKDESLKFVRISLDAGVADQWRTFGGRNAGWSVGNFHYSYSIKEFEFATNLVPIFDITVLNVGLKPIIITSIGIEILVVAQETRAYGIPRAARIPKTEHYVVEIPDVWPRLRLPDVFDPGSLFRPTAPAELMLDCMAELGDPVYVPPEGPFRFGLRLDRYAEHMPNIAVIRLVIETDLDRVESANIGIGRY